jgi:hypothetical protein
VASLWSTPGEKVYAVVDGAQDPRIQSLVRQSKRPWECLYAGVIGRELAEVAPYLVHLGRDDPFTERVVEEGWGKSWGFFATSGAELEVLRRHFRRFVRARLENGKTVLFRFYDPRVLRAYLPTCSRTELETFFGPLSRIVLEGEDAGELVDLAHRDGSLVSVRVPVAGEGAAPPRKDRCRTLEARLRRGGA